MICFFKDNLSYKKGASQSKTYPGTKYDAENAVDGNTETCMRTEAIGPNSPFQTVWWRVDLGGVYNIYSVNILFKNYDGEGTAVKIIKKPSTFHVIMYIIRFIKLDKLLLFNRLNSFKIRNPALLYCHLDSETFKIETLVIQQ